MSMRVFTEVLGWVGFASIISGYFAFTSRRVSMRAFHVFNLIGGVGLAANAFAHAAWPLAALNAVYLTIATFGLAKRG